VKFSALAFDLDGTLYPAYRLNFRLVPFLLKEQRHMRAMDKARKYLRESGAYEGEFYEQQAALMAEILGQSAEKIKERNERLIYRGWEPIFKKVRPFPHLRETLDAFQRAGIRMGLLSDFPPETKMENLKLSAYWDTMLCSEVVGRLKPDPASFLELARRLEIPPQQILYVGNSVPYDVGGARNAGMKSALIRPGWKKKAPRLIPDFVFHDYRQLREYVLN
jgi:putative hydrolase of the HAD superfamily